MPIKVNIIEDGIGIEFISSGIVTGGEVIDANNRLYTRDNLLRLRYKLIDRTTCTEYRVTPDEIRIIAEQDRMAAAINSNINVILISTTPLQYGMSRMWQAYTDETGFHTEIFSDRAGADAWLAGHLK